MAWCVVGPQKVKTGERRKPEPQASKQGGLKETPHFPRVRATPEAEIGASGQGSRRQQGQVVSSAGVSTQLQVGSTLGGGTSDCGIWDTVLGGERSESLCGSRAIPSSLDKIPSL